MTIMENGIYFNLPEDEYHAIPRLSASGICNILVSPATFWADSWMNPDKKKRDDDTDARILGRAYHVARFQPHLLDQMFVSKINPDDYEGLLTNATMIEAELDKLMEPKKLAGEKVLDKAIRLREAGYSKPILHLLQNDWEANLGDRQGISADYWQQLKRDMELLREDEEIVKHMTGGQAEVSVLWTEEGIDMKCRFDYLKPNGFTDLKTFDNPMRKNLENKIVTDFQYNRYYIQAFIYWRVFELIRRGKIDLAWQAANENIEQLIEAIRNRPTAGEIWYIFQEKKGIPNVLAREIDFRTPVAESHPINDAGVSHETSVALGEKTRRLNSLGLKAKLDVEIAMSKFAGYMDIYGPDEPWRLIRPSGRITDADCSTYFLES